MLHLPLLASILLLSQPAAATPPCARSLSGVHVPAFVSAASSELALQTECLVWESTVQPKAEVIPHAAAPSLPRLTAARTIVVTPYTASALDGLLMSERSFHLGAVFPPEEPRPQHLGRQNRGPDRRAPDPRR